MVKIVISRQYSHAAQGHGRDNGANPYDNPAMNPRTTSVHWLLALFMATVALSVGVVAAYAGWRAADADSAIPWLLCGVVTSIAVVAGFWAVLDRILVRRQFDHHHFPARPEFYDFDLLNQPVHEHEFDGQLAVHYSGTRPGQ